MTVTHAIILGAVQGLTEFLPVSSSGHLVLFQSFLGIQESMLAFDVAVHWGTLLAILVYFGRDVWAMAWQFFAFLFQSFSKSERKDL